MEEVSTKVQEEEILRKVRSKKRIRGLLIGINALLACYLIFEMSMRIVEYVQSKTDTSDYVTLYGNSREKSEQLYEKYLKKDGDRFVSSDIYDFGIYGEYLHLSYGRIAPGQYSSFQSLYPRRIQNFTDKVDVAYQSDGNIVLDPGSLDGGLKVTNLSAGEYVLFDEYIMETNYDQLHSAVRMRSGAGIEKTIYSLPGADGYRKKVTLRSFDSSPALVLTVSEVTSLPGERYDIVLLGEGAAEYAQTIPANYKYYIADSLADAYQAQAGYAFVLDSGVDAITGSHYLKNASLSKDSLYEESADLALHDQNAYIRELGGYLTGAGSGIASDSSTFEVRPYKGEYDSGKYTLLFSAACAFSDILEIIS